VAQELEGKQATFLQCFLDIEALDYQQNMSGKWSFKNLVWEIEDVQAICPRQIWV